ncbi:MAG: type VI secretion system ATPase TssH [Pseudomonadota bacterium]
MTDIKRSSLFGKLNEVGYKSLDAATAFCKLRGNPYVELIHWLHQILQFQDSDLHHIIRHFSIDEGALAHDMVGALDKLVRGASSISDLSAHVDLAVERGWVYASLAYDQAHVRTGFLLVGIMQTPELRRHLLDVSSQFERINVSALRDDFYDITSGSPEQDMAPQDGAARAGGETPAGDHLTQGGDALARFTSDLTSQATSLDPIVGRDEEIRQLIDILMRRRQNNPLLTGEAGVGKTAVVEGFAQRIVKGEVPPSLAKVRVHVLDVGLLSAGASLKGEFESRLRQVIDEVSRAPHPIILFIDEAHTLIGAGGAAGTGDAANLLKPALARGVLRTIAATTWAEYKKHIEKDPALTRRFQVIQVDEPDLTRSQVMLRQILPPLQAHHQVDILDEAVIAATELSARYIPARQLPDKAVSLLDTACARVATSLHAVPAALEDARHRIDALDIEIDILKRQHEAGVQETRDPAPLMVQREEEKNLEKDLTARWEEEKNLVTTLIDARHKLIDTPQDTEESVIEDAQRDQIEKKDNKQDPSQTTDSPEKDSPKIDSPKKDSSKTDLRATVIDLQNQLLQRQGETPLVHGAVTASAVAAVVEDWTGIPVGRMMRDDLQALLELESRLSARVVGQDHAMAAIAGRIRTAQARLDNPDKPIGVFMLCGPSGVGKTETALALAESLYGGEDHLITINMSEFQESHTVSTLKGAPPGYVGYGEGGVLTEAVRRRPYSVVLLDEVEKAHSDVHEIFFQVFDKGRMEDGEGRMIDFKNTLILLTSNIGTELISNLCRDPQTAPTPDKLGSALREPLLKVFPPALLGRLNVLAYRPLDGDMLARIVHLQLDRLTRRAQRQHGIDLSFEESVTTLIIERCTQLESGGRMIDAIVTNTLLPDISRTYLERTLSGQETTAIIVAAREDQFTYEVR